MLCSSLEPEAQHRVNMLAEPEGRTIVFAGHPMPGDPKRCREHSLRCAELAMTAPTPELKLQLIELSKNFLNLSLEMERNIAIMAMDDPPPVVPRKPT